jgi:hypothetical protein
MTLTWYRHFYRNGGLNVYRKPGRSLSKHIKSADHKINFDELKVTIIDHNSDWDNKNRLDRERFWITKLKTQSPNGINVLM